VIRIRLRIDTLIFIGIVALAAVLRLGDLGRLPLDGSEATLSLEAAKSTLQASPFWEGRSAEQVVSPLYHVSTALIFSFVSVTDAAARFLPALSGIGLVCLPYLLLRRKLGALQSVLMTAFLGLSPILITLSRTADGVSFALLGFGVGIGLLWRDDLSEGESLAIGAAFGVGLALTAGPTALDGFLTLTVGCLILVLLRFKSLSDILEYLRARWSRMHSLVAVGTALVLAGGMGFSMANLSALGEALAVWIGGWRQSSAIHPFTSLLMLTVYAPMTVVFGTIGGIQAIRKKDLAGVLALAWALGGLLLLMLYPDRSGRHFVWIVLPMVFLTSSVAADLIDRLTAQKNTLEFFAVCVALLVMFTFAYLQFAAYAAGVGPVIDPLNARIRLFMGGGILLITALVVVLFGLGWSWKLAFNALGISGGVVLLALSVMAIWRMNFSASAIGAVELWRPSAPTQNLRILVRTLENLSQTHTGREDALPVRVVGTAPAELAWALRQFPSVDSELRVDQESAPAYVFNDSGDPPMLASDYTGQGFKIIEAWSWRSALPPNPVRWWVRRTLPTTGEQWVLLVRLDIATLGESQTDEVGAP
jgi:hypothetical protein